MLCSTFSDCLALYAHVECLYNVCFLLCTMIMLSKHFHEERRLFFFSAKSPSQITEGTGFYMIRNNILELYVSSKLKFQVRTITLG